MESEYEKLKIEYEKLLYEYSENTIIQSMNDMKNINQLQKNRIQKLNNIIDNMIDENICIKIMINTLSKQISQDSNCKLKNRLEFIEEIIDNQTKH